MSSNKPNRSRRSLPPSGSAEAIKSNEAAMHVMKKFAKATLQLGVEELSADFDMINKESNKKMPEHRTSSANQDRNRYTDIFCVDATRVELKWPPGNKQDYIHANWIRNFPDLKRPLIATQAPTDLTIADFWRMIWQEKAAVIVMLCQLKEGGKKKADLYWPLEAKKTLKVADLQILNRAVTDTEENKMRVTSLVVKGVSSRTGEVREHQVTHVMWRGWPDKDVPNSSVQPIQLLHKIDTAGSTTEAPVVVHCSAGVGRTGTIIALEIALNTLLAGRELSVWNIVRQLRSQRYKACQTVTQYLYIHYSLLSYLALKGVINEADMLPFTNQYRALLANKKKRQRAA